jgi:hypothetical protein
VNVALDVDLLDRRANARRLFEEVGKGFVVALEEADGKTVLVAIGERHVDAVLPVVLGYQAGRDLLRRWSVVRQAAADDAPRALATLRQSTLVLVR